MNRAQMLIVHSPRKDGETMHLSDAGHALPMMNINLPTASDSRYGLVLYDSAPLSGGKILPGLRMFFGSQAFLMRRCISIDSGPNALSR